MNSLFRCAFSRHHAARPMPFHSQAHEARTCKTNSLVNKQGTHVNRVQAPRKHAVLVYARYGVQRGNPEISDRILGAVTYILPFLNAFVYARFLYLTVPVVRAALKPIMPAITTYNSVPLGSLIAFFALYLGVVNNKNMSRFVRFNAMQALLLDIMLILPRLMESVISPPSSGWGVDVYVHSQSCIWVFIAIWVIYGISNCILGQYGRIPFIADAADQQIR
ncbi:hypothetical protein CEUSTIGMA_g9750.t1 [Chlamydomonas eustigma]|uniref:Protein TIC 20 n=1 Tax=Chlamydomonas eustigma TaxID=1157962 RepID=A0A250XGW9_9CHLO|nr:hypothetical protein CEUSTIGMA_g9750.t1 [Chlamydomonas eustigma]|eukprot:GAX82321.1 hypothetical protein CEUSTIGMA_g9750.t1 [Chlamydomonas eustigma]